jgi:hypothetical protein
MNKQHDRKQVRQPSSATIDAPDRRRVRVLTAGDLRAVIGGAPSIDGLEKATGN